MNQENKQQQKSAFSEGDSGYDSDLSITKNVSAPSIEETLRAARKAVASARKAIRSRRGGTCECFGDD